MSAPDIRTCRRMAAVAFIFSALPGIALANGAWTVDGGIESSKVDIGNNEQDWRTASIQTMWRDSQAGGIYFGLEHQQREKEADGVATLGGFRRMEDWTVAGQVSAGLDRDFVHRYSIEPQISRRLFGNFVGQVGYIYRTFSENRIHLASLSGIQYFPKGEVEVKVAYGKNRPDDRSIRLLTLRAMRDDGSAFSYGGSASVGHNLYDAINIPGVSGKRGWILSTYIQYRLNESHSLRLSTSVGREDPSYRQRALGLSYRRLF